MVYISHHLKIITKNYLPCVFYTLRKISRCLQIGRVGNFSKCGYKKLPHFQLYGQENQCSLFRKVPMRCNTSSEWYIECITSNPRLKNEWLHIKIWHVLYISHHFLTWNNWYLHFLVYFKYLLNFQWRLFCRLWYGVTFFKLLHIKWHELPLHMIFLCYSKGVLEHTFNVFTKLSHVIVTWFYVSERFTIF